MADKDVGFWVAGVGAIAAMFTMAATYARNVNNSKEIAAQKKENAEYKKEIGEIMNAQHLKIKENADRINTMEMAVISRIDKHEENLDEDYMKRKEVDLRFDNLAQINTLQTEQILKVQESQSVQIDNIFKLLTKMRDQQIEYLQSAKKD